MALSRLLRVWRHRIRSLVRRSAVDAELDRELRYHLDALVEEKAREGLTPREARRAARREFGNVTAITEASRDQRRVGWVDDLRQDVVYGWRMLRRSPGVTAVAILSIAIGVGANAAVVGALDRVLVDGLPTADADRLVSVNSIATEAPDSQHGVSVNQYLLWVAESRAFDALHASLSMPVTLGGDDAFPAEQLATHVVSWQLFETLGASALLGRAFTFEEGRLIDPAPAIVISERLWRRRFGADPDVVGTTVRIDREPRTIVGVMPDSFRFQHASVDAWWPLRLLPSADQRAGWPLRVIGRLAPGISIGQATEDLQRLDAELGRDFPFLVGGWRPHVRPLENALLGWARQPLLMLQTGVVLVWLIACANVAGLLLARGTVRRREIGMRLALGAGRGRVVRQLLTETALLAAVGGVLAIGVAQLGLLSLAALQPPLSSPTLGPLRVDPTVVAVILVLSSISAVFVGLAPALAASRPDLFAPARSSEGHAGATPRHRARSTLVAVQFALAMALLIGAGLLVNSALGKAWRDINVDPNRLLTFGVTLPLDLRRLGTLNGFPYFEVASSPESVHERLLEDLRALPGVTSAGGSSWPVINSLIVPRFDVRFAEDLGPFAARPPDGRAAYYVVTPGLFETLRTPVLRGRTVTSMDVRSSPWVAVVNDTAARRFWPDGGPLGRMIRLDTVPEDQPRRIVGVVADIPRGNGELEPEPIVYASYLQQPKRWRGPGPALFYGMNFVVRTGGDPTALAPGIRSLVSAIDPDLPARGLHTFRSNLFEAVRRERELAILVSALGVIAAVLAAMGIYGAMSHAVNRRRREIGIRKALGASPYRVATDVARQAAGIVGAGVALGATIAVPVARYLEPQLWGVGPLDPFTYVAAALGLSAVAAVACLWPTRRAVAVDPARTLHSE